MSEASATVYAVTAHCRVPNPAPKSRPIAGRAMLTTVASIPASADPRMEAASTHRPAADATWISPAPPACRPASRGSRRAACDFENMRAYRPDPSGRDRRGPGRHDSR
ncbi:hypothetical protein M2266_000469 [Streptomyces sp. SPB162]|nr:hypothetical protein [Streptomyces sp. SPB162]